MASIYDIYIEQGSDFYQLLDITGDKTGYTIAMSVEDSVGTSTSGYVAWTDEALGKFSITMTNAQTSALATGIGKYNIEITIGGVTDRILQGRIYVDGDV